MTYLISNYEYDWEAFKKEEIIKASIAEFVVWFSKSSKILQLDIETNVVEKLYERQIYVVQIGDKDEEGDQWIFDIPQISTSDLKLLKSILGTKKKEWIIHNAAFEYTVIKWVFGVDLYKVHDTFLMSKVLFNGKDLPKGFHGLAGALEREFKVSLSKEQQTSFNGSPLTVEQILYAATDVLLMGMLYDKFEAMGELENSIDVMKLEDQVVRAFGDIQTNGMLLDWSEWLGNADIFKEELAATEKELNAMLYKPNMYDECIKEGLIQAADEYLFNWGSITFKKSIISIFNMDFKPTLAELKVFKGTEEQNKIASLLLNKQFESLENYLIVIKDSILIEKGIKVLKDTMTFSWTQQIKRLAALKIIHPTLTSTSDQALNRLSSPIVRKYKEWVKKSKLVSSFGESFKKYVDGDGFVRTRINQIMATGRISSSNPK